ncbi:MAG: hypothetical protein JSV62_00655 [Promethearchaeota archaeon]|nr:MAG: hypothetical protein JSV62_00655 [Candidatus Lokiarchaeota archaeon]
MQKQLIYKFFIPFAFLASVFSGPVYNLLVFLNTNILESHWSIYVNNYVFANVMALSFILFTAIFIVTIKYIEKLIIEPLMIAAIIVLGYCCIFLGLTWVFEIVILTFMISGCTLAYLIPTLTKFASDKIGKLSDDNRIKYTFPLSSLIWVIITFALFSSLGESWRIIYFVIGAINIVSSFAMIVI